MKEIIESHNKNEDCLSQMAIRIGSSESAYRHQKVPDYNSVRKQYNIKRSRSKAKVTNVVRKYVQDFDTKFCHRKMIKPSLRSSFTGSEVTSLQTMCKESSSKPFDSQKLTSPSSTNFTSAKTSQMKVYVHSGRNSPINRTSKNQSQLLNGKMSPVFKFQVKGTISHNH